MNNIHVIDPELKDKVILIIDDNPANLKVLFDCLEMDGYEILVARSGQSGIEKAQYARPDLILLDIVMPEMNGFEACKILKEDERTSKIPVIMITALADTDNKVEGFKHGAVDYITKPIRIEEVEARVATHLKLKLLNENLEHAIEIRTQELKQTNQKLEQEIEFRKQTESEVRHLRNFLNNIVDSMPSMLVGVDTKGSVTHWNKATEVNTKIPASTVQGKSLPEEFVKFLGGSHDFLKIIDQKEIHIHRKVPFNNKGEEQFSDITIYPLVTNGVEGAVIRVDDVTERVRIEEVMIQTEKMMTIGGLAAGMAHEINNPAAGVIQCTQVIQQRLSDTLEKNFEVAKECGTSFEIIKGYLEKREIIKLLDSVSESGQRIAGIVRNMLSFSRKSTSVIKKESITDLIDKTIEIAKSGYDIKKDIGIQKIEIKRKYNKTTPRILCEASKIQQVILNLIKNSCQAIAGSKEDIQNPVITVIVKSEDPFVCIQIQDNGPGMPSHVKERIFEPFFTTKKVGVGTGLGLSISYFIITENHKGSMAVESSSGNGATFTIKLPINTTSLTP